MKKIILPLILSAGLLCSCGNADKAPQTENTEAPTAAETEISVSETEASENEDEGHMEMMKSSLLSMGNNYRLKTAAEKLKSGEKTVIAYLGGSITEGGGGTPQTCWAKVSFNKLCERYGNTNSEYVNAGLSGTPSVLGNIRAERDILSHDPDIVFIEFAVNDSQDDVHRDSFESLICNILSRNSETAVVVVITRMEGGYCCQQHMSEIAKVYSVPVISVNDAITGEIESGRMEWKDYSQDYAHPNDYGHSLIADMVVNLFAEADNAEKDPPAEFPEMPLYGRSYLNMTLVTPENISDTDCVELIENDGFPMGAAAVSGGFKLAYKNDGSGGSIKLKVHGNSFFVIYKRNKLENMGKVDVYADGSKLKTIDSYNKDGWGDPFAVQVFKFQTIRDIEYEIKMSEGNEDKIFEIVGFGVSQAE